MWGGAKGFGTLSAVPLPRLRTLAATACLAGLGLATAACQPTNPYAAVVDGTTLSQTTLFREMASFRANKAFVSSYDQGQTNGAPGVEATATAADTFSQAFAAFVLRLELQAEVLHAEVLRRHVQPSSADVTAASQATSAQFGNDPNSGRPVFDGFDPWFRHLWQLRMAERTALRTALGPVQVSDPLLQQIYNENPSSFISAACVSDVLVASAAQADAVRSSLAGGADFATVARRYSIDPTAGPKGGALGCTGVSQFGATVAQAVTSLGVGQLSQPLQSPEGFHILLVTSRTLQPFDATVKGQISQAITTAGQALNDPINLFFLTHVRSVHVKLNPAYGTWNADLFAIVPPVTPGPAASSPALSGGGSPTATLPSGSTAPSGATGGAPPASTPPASTPAGSTPPTSTP